jgi:SAM-dependent methyltransferase
VRVGTADALPWPDDAFDLVVGLQSFFFGGDAAALLREAARVARPGATVVVQVPGPRERCDLEAVRILARPLMPVRPLAPELWREGALEALAGAAGLTPECAFDTSWAYEFADAATAGRAMLAAAGIAGAYLETMRATLVRGLERFRTTAGSYQLFNTYRYLVARAT